LKNNKILISILSNPYKDIKKIICNLFGPPGGPFGLAHIFCRLYRAGLKSPGKNSGLNFKGQARKKLEFGSAHLD
jgi:hypothetical protein